MMTPLIFIALTVIGIVVGLLGAMLGIGGGVLIVPILVLGFRMEVHTAIAVSLVSIIATSCATATMTTGEQLVNISLGMFLETGTTIGAITGAFISVFLPFEWLVGVFIFVISISAYGMIRKSPSGKISSSKEETLKAQKRSDKAGRWGTPGALDFSSSYYDAAHKATVAYVPEKLGYGWGMSLFAGAISGIIGIGGGVIKVPTMSVLMKVPVKVATSTSNFMIGVTAVASALVFYAHGLVDLVVASALLVGVFPGSVLGFRLAYYAQRKHLRYIFAIVLGLVAVMMVAKVLNVIRY
jgi:uncharacterized membrane protein YfcA